MGRSEATADGEASESSKTRLVGNTVSAMTSFAAGQLIRDLDEKAAIENVEHVETNATVFPSMYFGDLRPRNNLMSGNNRLFGGPRRPPEPVRLGPMTGDNGVSMEDGCDERENYQSPGNVATKGNVSATSWSNNEWYANW